MPVYEFYCKECNKTFEEITAKAEWDFIRCRKCGSKVEKMLTSPGMFDIKGYSAKNGYSKEMK